MLCGQFCNIAFGEVFESLYLTDNVDKICTLRAFKNNWVE